MIGFRQLMYDVIESDGPVNFTVGVISGQLRINVPFNFSTNDVAGPNQAQGIT